MITRFKDYSQNYTVSDTESLSQSLQDLALANQASVGNLHVPFQTGERVGYLALEESNREQL